MQEMYTEIGLSHDRGPSRDTGKATIMARRAKRVNDWMQNLVLMSTQLIWTSRKCSTLFLTNAF